MCASGNNRRPLRGACFAIGLVLAGAAGELRADHDILSTPAEGTTQHLLRAPLAIVVARVEEGDALVEGGGHSLHTPATHTMATLFFDLNLKKKERPPTPR